MKIILTNQDFYRIFGKKNIMFEETDAQKNGFMGANIREALKRAFPQNWKPQDEIFTSGIRGIYTIGSKDGSDEDWSIMNFFDSKRKTQELLYRKYKLEGNNLSPIDWMVNVFKNDKNFLEMLVEQQWETIKKGVETERNAVKFFMDKINTINPSDVNFYPPGSKMDKFNGVDVTISGKHFQIKPLYDFSENENKYSIRTYAIKDYKNSLANFIVFVNEKIALIFKNSNYVINDYENITFNQPPIRIIQ